MDEELQKEIDSLEDISPTTSQTLDLIVKEKLLSFLPNLQDILLTNITNDMEEQTDKCIQKLQDKANDIAQSSLNIQQEQDSYKQATEKIKNRIFFIDKQLEESTKRLEKYENNMNQKYEQLVQKKCNDVMESIAEKLTNAEEDIYATVESLKDSQAIAMTEITETLDRLRQKLPRQSENDDNHQETLANLQTQLTTLTRRIEDVNHTALADINAKISSISDEMQRQQELIAETLHREDRYHKDLTSKTNTGKANTHHGKFYSDSELSDSPGYSTNTERYHQDRQQESRSKRNRRTLERKRNKKYENFGAPQFTRKEDYATYDGTYQGSTYWTKNRPHANEQSNETKLPTYGQTYQQRTYSRYKNNDHPDHTNTQTIDTYFLRKNVKLSCTDDSQLLDFYIKLRLALKQGGIHLIPIENISKEKSLMDSSNISNTNTYNLQTNALYTILSNEDVIPNDYVQAQNCITSHSQYMDGFAALKSMLSTVHPNLTNNPPATKPPQLSEYTDLHTYDQGLRNYYLHHYLYDGHDPSDIQKSKQFIRGIDSDVYKEAKTRVIHQLDNHSNNNIPLPAQYTILNLASTILNMTEYHPTIKTAHINVARKFTNQQTYNFKRNASSDGTTNKFTKKKGRQPLTNTQCLACKTFGHKTQECNIVGKILAVIDLQQKKPELCDRMLQSHISKNTPSRRLAVVRTLQDMNILSETINAEDHLTNALVDNHITATVNAADYTIAEDAVFNTDRADFNSQE